MMAIRRPRSSSNERSEPRLRERLLVLKSSIEIHDLATDDLSGESVNDKLTCRHGWRARKYGSPASLLIASEVPVNCHNQTFAIAIQLGVIGMLAPWAMWIAHFLLFRLPHGPAR